MNLRGFLTRYQWLLLGFAGTALVAGIMAYYAFAVAKCLHFPWWFQQGSDGDGMYLLQALALINNGDLNFVSHPGGTVLAVHGALFNVLSWCAKPFYYFKHLNEIAGPTQTFTVLDAAFASSRILTVVLNVAAFALWWKLLFQIIRHMVIAFGFAFYFMTTQFMMIERLFVIRPELFNFMLMTSMLIVIIGINRKNECTRPLYVFSGALIGLLGGFSIFAKIQSIPQVVLIFAFWIFTQQKIRGQVNGVWVILAAVVNAVIFPWSWLNKPALMSPSYMKSFYPGGEDIRIYGPLPDTLNHVGVFIFAALLFVSVAGYFAARRYPVLSLRLLKLNLLVMGIITSLYVMFSALSMEPSAYQAASNQLLYATLTNLLYGGYLQYDPWQWATLQSMYNAHAGNQISGIQIWWFLLVSIVGSVFRMIKGNIEDKRFYAGIIFLYAVGLGMDLLSSMRMPSGVIVSSYAVYSLSAYVLGFSIWLAREIKLNFCQLGKINLKTVFIIILILHMGGRMIYLLTYPKRTVDLSTQTPELEMHTTMFHDRSFWHIVSRGQIPNR